MQSRAYTFGGELCQKVLLSGKVPVTQRARLEAKASESVQLFLAAA